MPIASDLVQKANEIAARVRQRASRIHQEYLDAQKLALDKKAEFDLADSALKRAADFKVTIG